MSQFEQGARFDPNRPNAAPPAPRIGIEGSIEVPPLATLPAVSQQRDLAIIALQTFNMAGDAIRLTGEYQSQRQALAEQEDRQAEIGLRGVAARRAETDLPTLARDISEGRIVAPNGVHVDQFATEYLNHQTEEFSPFYRDEYLRRLRPRMVEFLLKREDDVRESAREGLFRDAIAQSAGARDPAQITRAIEWARDTTGVPEEEARKRIGRAALEAAADRGDTEAFSAASTALGAGYEPERAQAAVTLERRIAEATGTRRAAALDDIGDLWLKQADPASGVTMDDIGRRIIELRDTGALDGSTAATAYQTFLNRKDEAVRDAARQLTRVKRADWENSVLSQGIAATLNARGGLAGRAALQDQETALPDGTSARLTEDQQVDLIVPAALRLIAAQSPEPRDAFPRQVEYLALNNFVSRDWSDILESGAGAGITAFASASPTPGGKTPELPKTTQAGYDLYRMLPPELRVTHASERTALLYETAMLAESELDKGKPADALLRAMQAVHSGAMTRIDETLVKKVSATWTTDQHIANSGIVHGQIKRLAGLLVNTNGGDEERAVRRAADIIKERMVRVGNALVPIRNRTDLPQTLPHLSELIAEHWIAGQTDSAQLDGDDFALLPTADPDLLVLHDLRGPVPTPVDGWADQPGAAFDKRELRDLERVLSFDPTAEPRVYSVAEVREYEKRGATQQAQKLAELARRAERIRFDRVLRRESLTVARRFTESARQALDKADDEGRIGPSYD